MQHAQAPPPAHTPTERCSANRVPTCVRRWDGASLVYRCLSGAATLGFRVPQTLRPPRLTTRARTATCSSCAAPRRCARTSSASGRRSRGCRRAPPAASCPRTRAAASKCRPCPPACPRRAPSATICVVHLACVCWRCQVLNGATHGLPFCSCALGQLRPWWQE